MFRIQSLKSPWILGGKLHKPEHASRKRCNGKPLAFYGPDKDGVIRMNNPEGKTDSQGRFTIKMFYQFSIGGHKVTEFAVGLDRDRLVSQGGKTVKVKFDEKTKKVDLGNVVIE